MRITEVIQGKTEEVKFRLLLGGALPRVALECPGSWRDDMGSWNDPGVQPEQQYGLGHGGQGNDGTDGDAASK